jgi:cell division protein FtsI/penicillin-binding protein 2
MKDQHYLRFFSLGVLISLLPLAIVLRMVLLQVVPSLRLPYMNSLETLRNTTSKIIPTRGTIVDRKGNLFATNQRTYEIGIAPEQVMDAQAVEDALREALGEVNIDVEAEVTTALKDDIPYIVVADFVTQEQIDKLEKLTLKVLEADTYQEIVSLNGIHYKTHLRRVYPNKFLGANLIGIFGWEEGKTEQSGIYGVEGYYNDMLADRVQYQVLPNYPGYAGDYNVLPEGANLVLTLDREIQAMAEQVLDDELDANGAESGTILIINPQTGEVLAMATTPRLDPNNYFDYLDEFPQDVPFNRAISLPIEPGSVFKVLTVAAALDSGAVDEDFGYVDAGVLEYAGLYIYNWDRGAYGPQGLLGCLAHSLNVCLSTLSTKYLGNETFYSYMHKFGIGLPTGVDMAGEISGVLKSPHEGYWHEGDLATNAFGQGLTTTPIQMAMAVSAIANDGKMMVPHIVKSIAQHGYQADIEQRIAGIPISEATADLVAELMAQSLETEASDALVPGYRVSGKTGTAQIPTPTGYHPYLTNASFIGFGPTDDPQFLIYINFEEPATSPWGSEVAAPVFAKVVEKLVDLMDLPPDDIRLQLAGQ